MHSTESVILKVSNNLLLTDDSGDSAILMLLDLMAAFNTVDHRIVISRQEQCVGIKGTALEWFRSYNSVCDSVSSSAPLPLCSPSGIYSRTYCVFPVPSSPRVLLQKIWHLVSLLCWWHSNVPAFETGGLQLFHVLFDCLTDIKARIASNFLHVNESKTEVLFLGPGGAHDAPYMPLCSLELYVRPGIWIMCSNLAKQKD